MAVKALKNIVIKPEPQNGGIGMFNSELNAVERATNAWVSRYTSYHVRHSYIETRNR